MTDSSKNLKRTEAHFSDNFEIRAVSPSRLLVSAAGIPQASCVSWRVEPAGWNNLRANLPKSKGALREASKRALVPQIHAAQLANRTSGSYLDWLTERGPRELSFAMSDLLTVITTDE